MDHFGWWPRFWGCRKDRPPKPNPPHATHQPPCLPLRHPQNLDHWSKWSIFCRKRKKMHTTNFSREKAKIFVTWPILDKNAKVLSNDKNFAEKAKFKKPLGQELFSFDETFAFLTKIGHIINIFAFPEKNWSCAFFFFSFKKWIILAGDPGFGDATRAGHLISTPLQPPTNHPCLPNLCIHSWIDRRIAFFLLWFTTQRATSVKWLWAW